MSEMLINTIAPWYGSNRGLAATVGVQLGKLAWCGVPFVGGAPEIPHIQTRTGLAADLHRHIINLARVIRDESLNPLLIETLSRRLFHPDELAEAQRRCIDRDAAAKGGLFGDRFPVDEHTTVQWAADYFMAAWMGRGGHAGKKTEFSQNLSVRWTASGGDSVVRFRNAIASLDAWNRALRLWQFELIDVFDFLARVVDRPGYGLYIDAPWPTAGMEYAFSFTDAQQVRLLKMLSGFKHVRIVIRYGDHPFIRELYPESRWTWIRQISRTQQNSECDEVLIINGPSYKEAA